MTETDAKKSQEAFEAENEHLISAIKKLEINSVLLSESKAFVSDEFAPDQVEVGDYVIQGYARRGSIGVSDDGTTLGFKVVLGTRLVHKDNAEKAKETESDEFTVLEVTANFMATYVASEPLTDEEERVFHERNVLLHVWPYWREFVQQHGWRMGAPYLQVRMLNRNRKLQ